VTRAKISQYSATANDNTDVNGINIAENCPPSSMNNMGREIMAALKRFQVGSDGDGVTVGGSLVVSGSTTANTFSATQITASGTIITAAGTNSAPAIVPTGDTNTGIFFPAADTIAFSEGGTEAMRIDSDGDVGIGETAPAAKLHIKDSGNTTADGIRLTLGSEARDHNIYSSIATGRDLTIAPWRSLTIQTGSGFAEGVITLNGYEYTVFGTGASNTERMRIDTSGNVGIGTSSPVATGGGIDTASSALSIVMGGNGAGGTGRTNNTAKEARLSAVHYTNAEEPVSVATVFNGSTDNDIRFGGGSGIVNAATILSFYTAANNTTTGGTERARITSGGAFLVGTTSSNVGVPRLTSYSETLGHALLIRTSNAGYDAGLIWNSATSENNRFFEFGTEGTYTARGSIDYNRAGGAVRYNTTSDATLKNIIGDSDGAKSVEILNSTRIREYAWKDDETQKPQIGVIAQELYETYKGAVSVGGDYEVTIPAVTEQRLVSEAVLDEDGNEIEAAVYETVETEPERTETKYRPWSVDKTAFTFHLVAGWQAHEKLIKQQAETIAALEARIAALEAK
jgi:hypothetical protein